MSDYDDDEDVVPPLGALDLTASDGFKERVAWMASQQIAASLKDTVSKKIEETVRAAITQQVQAFSANFVKETMAKIADTGWQKTDYYGHPQGPPITLAQRIDEELTRGDSYGKTRTFKEVLDARVAKELEPLIKEAKERFRAEVADVVKAKVARVLAESVGLTK